MEIFPLDLSRLKGFVQNSYFHNFFKHVCNRCRAVPGTLQADNVQDFARWERALQAGTGTEAGAEIHNDAQARGDLF